MHSGRVAALIRENVAGWLASDVDRVVATFAPDCVYIESHGPVHRGPDGVRRWMTNWLAEGQRVTRWDVVSLMVTGDLGAYEWVFGCSGSWGEAEFDGATVIRVRDGMIARLHEYRRTDPPFDWLPPAAE